MTLLALQGTATVQSAAEARLHLLGHWYLGDPWFLALAPIAIALLAWGRSRRGAVKAGVPALPGVALPRTLAQRLAWVPPVLQGTALVLASLALARPLRADVLAARTSEGVDIVLAVDRSSSMKYPDLDGNRTRLDVVKEVVGDFAVRRMTDQVGASDNVALITFAQYPQLVCPFTLDAGALSELLASVDLVRTEVEDGTAIGRGLAKAVALLADSEAESRVIVLLTDGENNVQDIAPLEAGRFAAEQNVRVYTVLAGRYVYQEDIFGRVYPTERELNTQELEQIAQLSGGRFFRARDRQALERVYAEIEALERTERKEERYTQTQDLYPAFLLPALALYALAWLSVSTWARRLP